jgi:hypothetical protein
VRIQTYKRAASSHTAHSELECGEHISFTKRDQVQSSILLPSAPSLESSRKLWRF